MKKSSTKRSLPQRTCIACRQVRGKSQMVRLVHSAQAGVQIDVEGKKPGRGAYLCHRRECWETVLKDKRKDRLGRALKTAVTNDDRERLKEFGNSLTSDPDAVKGTV